MDVPKVIDTAFDEGGVRGEVALEIFRRELAFSGAVFGGIGAYELIVGRLHGKLDPLAPANAAIALIEQAPRDAAGMVAYWTDIAILKPVNLAAGNRTLLFDVLNRGEQKALTAFCDSPRQTCLTGELSAGNGFLMRQGYTMAWTAWQGDIVEGEGLMCCGFPAASQAHGSIVARTREEFIFDSEPDAPSRGVLTYPAASLDPDDAVLTVRRNNREAPIRLGAGDWRYQSPRSIEIDVPDTFDRGAIFEFSYLARDPIVMGIGFAAMRDAVSFLRNDAKDGAGQANPLAGPDGGATIDHVLAFGTSQSGRVLRDMLWQGFNADLRGRRVFDGMFIDGAGSRKSFVNAPFGQPGRFSRQHEDHDFPGAGFPFTYGVRRNVWSGDVDGILKRSDAAGVTPKIIHTDSSSEYWQARAALVTTDQAGADLVLPDNVRAYHYASVQHGGAAARPLPIFAYPTNPLSETPLNRALLTALNAWVSQDVSPPPSRVPMISDGSLVAADSRESVGFPEIPGVGFPAQGNDLRPTTAGIQDGAAEQPAKWRSLVPRVDADGNEIAGIRVPAVTVPLATYTGWNLRREGYAPGELASVRGAVFPFAATRAERERIGDPRPSLEERYAGRQDYVAKVAAAAQELEGERMLLREDTDRLVEQAAMTPLPNDAHN